MRKLIVIPVCTIALLVPVVVVAAAGQGGFEGVVRGIEAKYHVRAERIPFMGLVSLVAHGATHGGVSGMQVAEFDDVPEAPEGEALHTMVKEQLGPEWHVMVRETSRHGHGQTLVFARPEGRRMGLFVVDTEGREIDVVEMAVDPEHLGAEVGKYGHGGDKGTTE